MASDAERVDLLKVDGGEGFALVQAQQGRVRLVVSISTGGDYDVLLSREAATQLGQALTHAAEAIQ